MNTEIYFSEISEEETVEIKKLLKLISGEKQNKLKRYRFPIERKLSLYSELLVRWQAIRLLGLNNEEIEFVKNEYGKSTLQNYTSFHFNISHARNAIVVIFSNEGVGVDIEKVKPFNLQIAKRFFNSSEQDYINSHENPNHAFYEVWTKKEAYIKCIGRGFAKSLKSFDVLNNENLISMYVGEYIISICCNEPVMKLPQLIILTEKDLISSLKKMSPRLKKLKL